MGQDTVPKILALKGLGVPV